MRALLVYYMTKQLLFGQEKSSQHLRLLHRLRLFHADHRRHDRRPLARQAPGGHHRRHDDGGRPFHDGVRAAVLRRAGDHRARQRAVPAEPAEPDQRPLRCRRPAPAVGLQRLLCRRERRRVPGAARLRIPRRDLRLALRLRRAGVGMLAGLAIYLDGQALSAAANGPKPRRSCAMRPRRIAAATRSCCCSASALP